MPKFLKTFREIKRYGHDLFDSFELFEIFPAFVIFSLTAMEVS